MSPQFNFDPSKVQAGFFQLDKGEAILKLGEPKAFYEDKKDAGGNPATDANGVPLKKYGIRYPTSIVMPEQFAGKRPQPITCYMHTEGAQGFSKGLVMAAMGFTQKQEEEFNAKYAHADWSYDTETGAVGDVWREINGHLIKVIVDVQPNNRTGELQSQYKSYQPAA